MSKNAIVVGMPRSGTSLAASIFVKQGYFVAEEKTAELRAGDRFNPDGYWESDTLIDANVSLFERVGFRDDNTWMFSRIHEQQFARISTLAATQSHRDLVQRYMRRMPWVWKDPRLCYTLGYWWQLVDQEETRVLLVRREPEAIFRSFCRMGWRKQSEDDRQEVFRRIECHIGAAERSIKELNIPHIEIDYSEYIEVGDDVADRLSSFFGLSVCANDLGFANQYNSSSLWGRARILIEKLAELLPARWRTITKRMIPKKLLRRCFPGQFSK